MDLILWRHAEAEDNAPGGDDLRRALTAAGERQAERMAVWLGARLAAAASVIVSPALRCQQTAKTLGREFRTVAALGPGEGTAALLRAAGWPDAAAPVLVVGHQPTLGAVASLLVAGSEQGWSVRKGAVWWLRQRSRDGDRRVVVQAVQGPEDL